MRFLEIAEKTKKPVAVVTDNDGNFETNITNKYEPYESCNTIKICADSNNSLRTMEPQFVEANKGQLNVLRKVLGINETKYSCQEVISDYMQKHKTDCALKIFNTEDDLNFPQYILNAIDWEYEQQ